MIWKIFASVSCVKMLLIPAYKSTDFEVHRNWLALTHSLPISKWYLDSTSEWTLDYPPFFAWFEYLLSLIAYYFDENMLNVNNLNYSSKETILFQRLSVIFSDLVLLFGCKEITSYLKVRPIRKSSKLKLKWSSPSTVFYFLVLANAGLLIVDHIHFQYNGFLLGILLISIGRILKGNFVLGSVFFCVLLNMKHIFIYMSPAYFIYLLRNYCIIKDDSKINYLKTFYNIVLLGSVVVIITFISFGPFIILGQMSPVLSRLFPFKRGLSHAYWAPNFWAMYNFFDKCLQIVLKIFFNKHFKFAKGNMTSGLVQEQNHIVLPHITPSISLLITVISMLPCLYKLIKCPGNPFHFVRSVVICSCCSFIFGWHVHEKAILMIIIPQSLMAVLWRREAEFYSLITIVGHYSLLPLIFTSDEFLIKLIIFVLFSHYVYSILSDLYQLKSNQTSLLNKYEKVYVFGLVIIFSYENILFKLLGHDVKYPFLPLMLTSSYCSAGVLYSTFKYYFLFLSMDGCEHKQITF